MFEWLNEELDRIKTPKFHLVDGPLSKENEELVRNSPLAVPPSYTEFVVRFGNATLYRQGSTYQVQVYGVPVETESRKGEKLIHFGRTDMGLSYFKEALLVPNEESPVFDWFGPTSGLRCTADGFEEWLTKKCKQARRQYKKTEWSAILEGPEPFTDKEKAIVAARDQFNWRLIGIAENGDLRFEIHNGSNIVLPYLTIGVRSRHEGGLVGGAWLKVSHIPPGATGIVEMDCYKDYVRPEDVEVFNEPSPGPEDRDQYWEFRHLSC